MCDKVELRKILWRVLFLLYNNIYKISFNRRRVKNWEFQKLFYYGD